MIRKQISGSLVEPMKISIQRWVFKIHHMYFQKIFFGTPSKISEKRKSFLEDDITDNFYVRFYLFFVNHVIKIHWLNAARTISQISFT